MATYQEPEGVDINDLELLNEEIEYNPEAELTGPRPIPPETERPVVRLKLGEKGFLGVRRTERRRDGSSATFIQFQVQATVIAPGKPWDGAVLFDNPSSMIFGETSALHRLLKAVGRSVPTRTTLRRLKEEVEEALASEPLCRVSGRWEARAKDASGNYKTVLSRMRSFPQAADGTYVPEVIVNGERVRARFVIRDYFPLEPDDVPF